MIKKKHTPDPVGEGCRKCLWGGCLNRGIFFLFFRGKTLTYNIPLLIDVPPQKFRRPHQQGQGYVVS